MLLSASRGTPDAGFPRAYEAFESRGVRLVEPSGGVVPVGTAQRFSLRAPGALDVAVVTGGRWIHLTRTGEEFAGEVRVVRGSVVVYAKYSANGQFVGLLRYAAR